MGEFDHHAVVTGGMAGRLKQPDPFSDLLVALQRLKSRRVHVESRVKGQRLAALARDLRGKRKIGIAEMLEGLRASASFELLGMADGACSGEVLVTSTMIEVIVRIDHVVDVLRF